MLDETIDLLTKQMIEKDFQLKKENKDVVIKMKPTDLYNFCIKLIKLIKRVESIGK